MKEKPIKQIALGVFGALQGIFGTWWLLAGFAGAFPGTEPGSKDYEEDMWFVPFGWGMMLLWLAVMAVTIILNRKNKANLLSFLIPWFIVTFGYIIVTRILILMSPVMHFRF